MIQGQKDQDVMINSQKSLLRKMKIIKNKGDIIRGGNKWQKRQV